MTKQEIERKLRIAVSEVTGYGGNEITLESSLENDLKLDSLDTVELVMAVEDEFLLEVSQDDEEDAHEKVKTFGDLLSFVEKLVEKQHKDE